MDAGVTAQVITLVGVIVTAILTAVTTITARKSRGERDTDRRKIEEETTDVILERVKKELRRAYATIDERDEELRSIKVWLEDNRPLFRKLGMTPFPELPKRRMENGIGEPEMREA